MTRATKVQAEYIAVMKQGHPALIDHGVAFNNLTARHHGGGEGSWLWMAPNTARAMKRHGWIEWHPGSAEKRAGYYITDAGREVLPT